MSVALPFKSPEEEFPQARKLPFLEKWTPLNLLQIGLYLGACFMVLTLIPNSIWDPEIQAITYVIGVLGLWRYLWWFTHFVRATIYGRLVYPRLRERGDAIWQAGWRPRHLHFMMTTFREHREITEAVIRGIVSQVREAGCPATLWLGSGDSFDEDVIATHLALVASDIDITFRIIRQNQPGKRMAIALVLRAMSRAMISDNDPVVFMDGDFVIAPGTLRKCLQVFAADPECQALTTDEDVIVRGAWWMQSWLDMRFAQRRLAMQSHALSNRVITLTGRMSMFRARHVKQEEFIRLLEADYLDHWLWGKFRFLSGDDKSTWFYMLKHGHRLLYVPDATGYTIEVIKGSAFKRMVENFRRWSGNMLRNGKRAIALGPTRMPFFIWWCLLDQRLAMWTMLVSPVLAISATLFKGLAYALAYFAFLAMTRMLLSIVIFCYARKVDLNFVWILYINQITNASVKVFMLWRLAKQKWSNRGDQRAGFGSDGGIAVFREVMANYLTVLSVVSLFLATIIYARLLELPSWDFVRTMVLP